MSFFNTEIPDRGVSRFLSIWPIASLGDGKRERQGEAPREERHLNFPYLLPTVFP